MLTPRKGLFAVALVLLCCALLSPRWTGWLTRPVNNTVETLQRPAGWLASSLESDPAVERETYPHDKLVDLLESERAWNEQLRIENERLLEQLDAFNAITETRSLDAIRLVEARVSNFNNDPVNPTMKLLRGTLHGLKADDAVAYKSNLVGFVTHPIGPVNATVSLITRPGFQIEVNIMPPEGVRSGEGWPITDRAKSDGKGGFTCVLNKDVAGYLQPGDLVRVNDALRESANGFVLGVVELVEPDQERPHLLSQVSIRPRTPIGPQRHVTVLTDRTD